ncbi:EpsG family protein [Enterococcus asini]|nr:EpsG family protein [Enterococcus asini]
MLFFYLFYVFFLSYALVKKVHPIVLFISLLPFLFLGSLRNMSVGNDSIEYARVYQLTGNGLEDLFTGRYEVGFLWLNKFLNFFSNNYALLFSVCMIIVIVILFYYVKEFSELWGMSIALFFLLRYFDMSMNVIRLSVALSLTMLGTLALKKNKKVIFFLLVIVAALFHRTAIVTILFLFITKKRLKFKPRNLIFLASFLILFNLFFSKILEFIFKIFPLYSYYINSEYLDGSIRIATILNIFVTLFIFGSGWIIEKRKNQSLALESGYSHYNNKFNIDTFCFNSGIIGLIFLILSIRFNLLDRVADFFLINSIIYLPNQLSKIKNTNLLNLLIYLFITIFMIYYIVIIVFRPEWNTVYPYRFFWQ